jgi:hypothetical protein
MTRTLEILKRMGGIEWKGTAGEYRIYFNNRVEFYGDIENLDRFHASEINRIIRRMRVWYDVKTGKITYSAKCWTEDDIRMAGFIFETIKRNIIAKFKETKEQLANEEGNQIP